MSLISAAFVSACIRQHTTASFSIRQHESAYVSIRQHTSAYVSIRQHTSAYVSRRLHLMLEAAVKLRHIKRFILIAIDRDASVFPFSPAFVSVCLKGKDWATPLFLQF
jgi:hypothetical protein